MLNFYFILLLLLATTTANHSEFSLFKRADEPDVGLQQQADQQASRTIEYDFDLNKTPPRDSDGSPERFSSTPKKKPRGRPRVHATKEEKRMADSNYRKRYRKQYTLSEIEKTKQVLQGEKLREFLAKANDYKTKARIRQERKRLKQTHKRITIESQKAAQRALNFHEKMKQGDSKRF